MPLTRQEIFDKALFGIRGQNYKKSLIGKRCAYRGADELKCAIGHCVDDDTLAYEMDASNQNLISLMLTDPNHKCYTRLTQIISPEDHKFAVSLQQIHDHMNRSFPDYPVVFEARMKAFAAEYELEYIPQ